MLLCLGGHGRKKAAGLDGEAQGNPSELRGVDLGLLGHMSVSGDGHEDICGDVLKM